MDNSSSEGNSQPKDNAPANRISLDNMVRENNDNEVSVLFNCFAEKLYIIETKYDKFYVLK